mmetsp:Transcript_8353/g.30871  ORF Transcript_8353/g.30871 Transcript_8353/m.30871 type:complete len:955 (-) Transcript_8353:238-3102(-)|eukprot:CAMPEP_0117441468 /NCGR_PEP_ID=MMETSP0759-20121206/3651_1 /TAXON_ID=63605 /ORGANISM="Percolomonas cosmopolitus, Strain WS" /LENGTH=954 /DNA_ID=CAMNT_0005233325 /DNA_START=100 /DNA_END=2964 /DNA_ORIENTATION=+
MTSATLFNLLCPDGFHIITPQGFFLSSCIRDGLIILIPLVIYALLGPYRFASIWDRPLWHKWILSEFFLNRRISLWYKASWLLRFLCIVCILIFVDFRTFLAIFDAKLRTSVAGITYLSDAVKLIAWMVALANFFIETRRNQRTWWVTHVFYVSAFVSSLFQQVYYIQVVFSDRQLNLYDIRGIFFELSFTANFVLIILGLLSVCFPQLDEYKDSVTEARLSKLPKKGVNLRIIDVVDLFVMGWYFLVPGLVFATGQGVAVQLIADIAGKVLEVNDPQELQDLCRPFLWLIPIAAFCTIFQMSLLGLGGETILMKLRNRLFGSFGKQDISFFQKTGTGYLISRMTTDCDIIGLGLTVHISAIVPPLVAIITGAVILVKNSPTLSSFLISLLALALMVTVMRSRIVTQRYSAMYSDKRAVSTRKATEVIQGIDVVKTFGKEKEELKEYKKLTASQRVTGFTKEVLESCFEAVEISLNKLIIALGVYVGATLVLSDQIDRSELNSYLLVGITTLSEFYALIKILPELYNISAPAERVFTLMKMKPTTNLDKGFVIPDDTFRGEIEFKNVTFSYPAADPHEEPKPVLHDVSLKIAPHETVAFVGASGSGKSTMLALAMRFFDVQEGTILIDGHDIKSLKPRWWMQMLGIVAQQSILFAGSIEDNIKYSCKTKAQWNDQEAFDSAVELADVAPVIDSHEEGIHFNVGAGGSACSGGMRQRISIARMARKEPACLILDEVTSALDPESEEVAMRGLKRLSKGKTTLIIAHRLHTITFADKIVAMKKGKILEVGTHDELMAIENGYYRDLFEKQQTLGEAAVESVKTEKVAKQRTSDSSLTMQELSTQVSDLLDSIETFDCFQNDIIKERVSQLQSMLNKRSLGDTSRALRQQADEDEQRNNRESRSAMSGGGLSTKGINSINNDYENLEDAPLVGSSRTTRPGESLLEEDEDSVGDDDV